VLTDASGKETRFALPGPARELTKVGDGWLAAFPYLIRVSAGSATIYRLPEAKL
jgi:hypothetical protein